ncbi:MAG: ester cyclase [Anaerolineae bacterium]|nr:ester cyclase [Anaerolineae bacterium]
MTIPLLIADLVTAWNTHDVDHLLPLYAPDYEGLDVAQKDPDRGQNGVRAALERYCLAFPDLTFTLENIITQESDIALSWSARGTHQGYLMHIPPTGRSIAVQGMSLLTLRKGLIWRGHTIWDVAGLLRGLGLLPDL